MSVQLFHPHAGSDAVGHPLWRRGGVRKLLSLWSRLRPYGQPEGIQYRTAPDAPWVAEMLSAFGGALDPFMDPARGTPASAHDRRKRARRRTDLARDLAV